MTIIDAIFTLSARLKGFNLFYSTIIAVIILFAHIPNPKESSIVFNFRVFLATLLVYFAKFAVLFADSSKG